MRLDPSNVVLSWVLVSVGCTAPSFQTDNDRATAVDAATDSGFDGGIIDGDAGSTPHQADPECGECPANASCDGKTCRCGEGYERQGARCVDVNECDTTENPCGPGGICQNAQGGFACSCQPGFTLNADGLCVDIDECALDGEPHCWPGICANEEGTHRCTCPAGFAGTDTTACSDVDECATDNGGCGVAPCVNAEGSFACGDCPIGFLGSAGQCTWNDPRLDSLVVSGASLMPAFAGGILGYVAELGRDTASATLTATLPHEGLGRGTLTFMDGSLESAAESNALSLWLGDNAWRVGVMAESGATRTYDVLVRRGWTNRAPIETPARTSASHPIAVSADGSTLAMGAPLEDSTARGVDGAEREGTALDSGAVYVFRRSSSGWSREAFIKSSNSETEDQFGTSLSLSADGSTLVVGAPGEDGKGKGVNPPFEEDNSIPSGAAYVFSRSGSSWAQQAYLKPSNTAWGGTSFGIPTSMWFGTVVSVSADGSTVAISAPYEASPSTTINGSQTQRFDTHHQSGAVYVLRKGDTGWTQEAYIKSPQTKPPQFFGQSIALSSDGSILAVGEPGGSAGVVYAFVRSEATWQLQAKLSAPSGPYQPHFGERIAISSDGNTIATSDASEQNAATGVWTEAGPPPDVSASRSGAVLIFSRDGTTWSRRAYLKASNTRANAMFGSSLALSSDGGTLAVGASQEDGAAALGGSQQAGSMLSVGAVYLFRLESAVWGQIGYLKSPTPGQYHRFGTNVALSADGSLLAVNGRLPDNPPYFKAAVFLYE